MKKILVVGGFHTDKDEVASLASFYDYMQRTFSEHTVTSAFLDDIEYAISPAGANATIVSLGCSVAEYDIVYIRGPKMRLRSEQAFYLSRFCSLSNIHCVNDYSLYYPGTKVAQALIFLEDSVPFLDTLYTRSNNALIDRAEQHFGYPYILKTTSGSHGDANYLIRTREDAERSIAQDEHIDFLAQQYCLNDRDYRILVTPQDSLIFARKGSDSSHLNNTSKGAAAELAAAGEVPEEVIESARRVAKRLKLDIAGVDVMPRLGTKEFYFLEVNSQPQLVTGVFLEEKATLMRALLSEENAAGS